MPPASCLLRGLEVPLSQVYHRARLRVHDPTYGLEKPSGAASGSREFGTS